MAGSQIRVRKVLREMGVPSRVAKQQVVGPEPELGDVRGELGDEVGGQAHGASLVVLGVGLGEHPGCRWGSS